MPHSVAVTHTVGHVGRNMLVGGLLSSLQVYHGRFPGKCPIPQPVTIESCSSSYFSLVVIRVPVKDVPSGHHHGMAWKLMMELHINSSGNIAIT